MRKLLWIWNAVRKRGAPKVGRAQAEAHEEHLRAGYKRDHGRQPTKKELADMKDGVQYWFEGVF